MFELNRLADEIEKIRTENEQLSAENKNFKALMKDALDTAETLNEDLHEEPWLSMKEAINNESTNQD